MKSRTLIATLVFFGAFVSCHHPEERAAPPEQAALGGAVAARVAGDAIPVSLVAQVARDSRVAPPEALRRLIDDAVAASAARGRGLDREAPASWLLTAARARFTSERLLAEAKAKGPPTDDEVRALSDRHWREVDRPEAVRVVHALAKRPKKDDPAAIALAKQTAQALHTAVLSAHSVEEFREKAKAVPHPSSVEVVVEDLPAFTDDGYVIDANGRMVESFARPAHALAKPGDTSQVVETEFGWHVMRLVERVPEQRMPLESRRMAFAEEAYAMRARDALDATIAERKKGTPIELSSAAEPLMRTLSRGSARPPHP